MRIAKDTYSYIQQKLKGENVISPGSALGISALNMAIDDFVVLQLERDTYSYYTYRVDNGKFRVEDYAEQCPHHLFEELPKDVFENADTLKWHNCVFDRRNDDCIYDEAYNNLRISESCSMLFGEAIEALSSALRSLHFPNQKQIFLVGNYTQSPLVRYVLQKELNKDTAAHVQLLNMADLSAIEFEMEYVLLDQERANAISIYLNGGMSPLFFVNAPAKVNIPIVMSKNEIVKGHPWGDLLTDVTPDFRVGNFDYKYLTLHTEYDALGGVYLVGKDVAGNSKAIKL